MKTYRARDLGNGGDLATEAGALRPGDDLVIDYGLGSGPLTIRVSSVLAHYGDSVLAEVYGVSSNADSSMRTATIYLG